MNVMKNLVKTVPHAMTCTMTSTAHVHQAGPVKHVNRVSVCASWNNEISHLCVIRPQNIANIINMINHDYKRFAHDFHFIFLCIYFLNCTTSILIIFTLKNRLKDLNYFYLPKMD